MLRAITKAKITKTNALVSGNTKVTPENVLFPKGDGFTGTLELVLNLPTSRSVTAFAYVMTYATKEEFLRVLEIILGMRKLYDCSYSVNIGGEILIAGNTVEASIDLYETREVSIAKVVA